MKTKLGIVAALLIFCAFLSSWHKLSAASANSTITIYEATLECDSSIATATIAAQSQKGGYIVNGGTVSVWVNFQGNGLIAATNGQNNTGEIEMTAGATVPVRPSCRAFSYKAASATSVLYWFPSE